ncbi:hypothetical protein B0H14DRAFT_3530281 [Mycena olivaceomarginata]|nr:hypothetical protein B0H14DRAFT_3530281 [Mycena olivaceomarginata]
MASSDGLAASSPLQDRTNQPTAPATLESMEEELTRLKSLLDSFSTRRGRGRGKRMRDDTSSDADHNPKKSKTEPATDYFAYGQVLGRFLGCHVTLHHVIEYGCHMDTALSGDEGETKPRLEDAWKIVCSKFAGFHEYLLELSKDPSTRRGIIKQMTLGMDSVRSADTSTCKRGVPDWLLEDPASKLEPALPNKKDKIYRGMAHPEFAAALTPMGWEACESTWKEIVEGEKQIAPDQLPRFIFPCAQVFPIDKEPTDPAWGAVLANTCKGEVVLRAAKAIYMGPEAALETDGYHKGKPGNASIIGLTTFTPRTVAGVVTQVRFALSSKQDWNKMDGDFNYEEFFLDDPRPFRRRRTGQRHHRAVEQLSLVLQNHGPPLAQTASGPSALAQIKAARAAQKRADAAAAAA